jgi:hypothetical protein
MCKRWGVCFRDMRCMLLRFNKSWKNLVPTVNYFLKLQRSISPSSLVEQLKLNQHVWLDAKFLLLLLVVNVLWPRAWQKFEPSWRLAIGTFLGFMGAAFGSVGGVGGGGFYLPILSLVIGFDTKTTTALSKCEFTRQLEALQSCCWEL